MSDTATTTPAETSEPTPSSAADVSAQMTQAHEQRQDDYLANLDKPATLAKTDEGADKATAEAVDEKPKPDEKAPKQPDVDPNDPKLIFAGLSEDDQQLVRRQGYEAEDVPADATRRANWLRRLDKIQRDRDRVFAANGKNKNAEGAPEPAEVQPPPAATAVAPVNVDEAYTSLNKSFDELGLTETIPHLRKAIDAQVDAKMQKLIADLPKADQLKSLEAGTGRFDAFFQKSVNRQFDSAIKTWKAPEGVDLSKPEAIAAVRVKADLLWSVQVQQGTDPNDIDIEQLTHQAASLAFPTQQQQAARRAEQQQSAQARRGSAESGVRAPTTQPPMTREDRQDEWLATHPAA